jgi:hypothetical protein
MRSVAKNNPAGPAEQRKLAEREREAVAREERLRARFARLDALPRRPFEEAGLFDAQGLAK